MQLNWIKVTKTIRTITFYEKYIKTDEPVKYRTLLYNKSNQIKTNCIRLFEAAK